MKTYQKNWKGHVERMQDGRFPKLALKCQPVGKRSRGRPKKKRWQDQFFEKSWGIQDCEISSSHGGDPWWWRQYVPLKRRSTINLHGSTTQKTALNMNTGLINRSERIIIIHSSYLLHIAAIKTKNCVGYSLEYTDTPKVLFMLHHERHCCTNVVRGHFCSTMSLGHCLSVAWGYSRNHVFQQCSSFPMLPKMYSNNGASIYIFFMTYDPIVHNNYCWQFGLPSPR
jgi:hypothetical protein